MRLKKMITNLLMISLVVTLTQTLALADSTIKTSETIKTFATGKLCKAKYSDNTIKDVIIYNNGTSEVYDPAKHDNLFPKNKISEELKKKIDASATAIIPVIIWIADLDQNSITQNTKDKLNIQGDVSKESPEKIKQYIEERRKKSKEEYTGHNKNFYLKHVSQDAIIFASNYAPCVIANVDPKTIEKLVKDKDVLSLDLFVNTPREDEVSKSIPNINANYTRDTLNLKGTGVKVGILEGGYPDKYSNPQLTNRTIIFDVADSVARTRLSIHATKVTTIIVGNTEGIVPNATVYVAQTFNRSTDYDRTEWLISQGVTVINYSAGYTDIRGQYSAMAKWYDHLGTQHNVHFVKSAGNSSGSTLSITDPGMAYNIFTVGSIYEHDSATEPYWNDDTFSTFSCYTETSGGYKPDLTAPGEGITVAGYVNNSGTSMSAPHVTGVLAQMINYNQSLTVVNPTLKAILAAGTLHRTSTDFTYGLSPFYSNKEGIGVVDAKGAHKTASTNGYYSIQLSTSQFPYQKTFTVSSTSSPVRVSLAWLKQNTITQPNHVGATVTERNLSDLDLEVYAPNGNLVGSSCSGNNNLELIQFNPSATGTYTIKVIGYAVQNSTEWISLAWYQ